MPVGSPGMDGPAYGQRKDPYDVLLVAKDGNTTTYQRYSQGMTMKNLKKLTAAATTALVVTLAPAVQAQSTMAGVKTAQATAATTAATTATTTTAPDMTDGEVRKIDMQAGKLRLKHGEIKNLDMPGMTMVFVVKDKAMLDTLNTGDKVKFKAINDAGKFTVTEIQAAR